MVGLGLTDLTLHVPYERDDAVVHDDVERRVRHPRESLEMLAREDPAGDRTPKVPIGLRGWQWWSDTVSPLNTRRPVTGVLQLPQGRHDRQPCRPNGGEETAEQPHHQGVNCALY